MNFSELRLETLAWPVLFLPLLAAAGITLMPFIRRRGSLSAKLSIGAVVLSFVFSLVLFIALGAEVVGPQVKVTWLAVGNLIVDLGFRLDSLSLMMLLIVTGVGSAIHIYSYGYMKNDPGLGRYFASLSLFTFSMLGIVLADNFFMMFVFWELVGVSSYLLIGFWHQHPAAADACKKAFLTNRLGDFGFLLGIVLLWAAFDTTNLSAVNFEVLQTKLRTSPRALGELGTVAGLLIFCGAMGKSAQFPLHVWLPDAMEGPTPVSALIHAATMVAAGVYMLCRVFFIFTPDALLVIACIGAFTALLAALIAVQQNDIKRILAYSTLSQLGYMVMAVGLGGPTPAMFHLTTHAFFKALLFLGAGSVIHALHHEQDIWKMGNLRHRMPVTFVTFLLGTLALCGVPPFSGFFSKDEILALAADKNPVLFAVAVLVAALTTFYMARLVIVAFFGPAKSHAPQHAHEPPAVMTVPLILLAVPSTIGGFIGIAEHFSRQLGREHYHHEVLVLFASFGAVLFGFSAALGFYWNATKDPLPETFGSFTRVLRHRFYFDELYGKIIAKTHEGLAKFADAFDRWIIAGLLVRGLHGTTELAGRALRLVQTGNLQTYAFLFAAGLAVVLYLALGR